MGYVILEYLVSVVAVLAFAAFVFVVSLVMMLAKAGLARVLGPKDKAGSLTSQIVVRPDSVPLEGSRSLLLSGRQRGLSSLASRNVPVRH